MSSEKTRCAGAAAAAKQVVVAAQIRYWSAGSRVHHVCAPHSAQGDENELGQGPNWLYYVCAWSSPFLLANRLLTVRRQVSVVQTKGVGTQLPPSNLTVPRRKRHVKCDETKPSCLRCVKWKGKCDGYLASDASPDSSAFGSPRIEWTTDTST